MTSHVVRAPQQQEQTGIAPRLSLAEGMVLVAAALVAGSALMVMLGVIPPVRDDWAPQRLHAEGAVPAFWVAVTAHLVAAVVLVATATFGGLQHRALRWVLVVLGAGALVQALLYLDAVAAFHEAPGALEPRVQSANTWLVGAIVIDVLAGLLVIAGTVVAKRGGTRPAP